MSICCIGEVRSRRRRASGPRWEFRPYRQAAVFVQSLRLRSQKEWKEYCKGTLFGRGRRPDDIPAAPDLVYRNEGWRSWGDWLGTGTEATQLRRYREFAAAREFVRENFLLTRHLRDYLALLLTIRSGREERVIHV